MKELYKEIQDKNPNLSSIMCFVKLVKGKGYTKGIISRNFKLVDKEDYEGSDRKAILKWLFEIGLKQGYSGKKSSK